MTTQDLGPTLRRWRLGARLTQRELALRIGFHESAVASIERGERAPSAQYLDGFAAALRLEPSSVERMWLLYKADPAEVGRAVADAGAGTRTAKARAEVEVGAAEAEVAAGAVAGAGEGVSAELACPYRGLLAFREQDSTLYFGREYAVELVAQKLRRSSLVGIVGASWSGKSSAVFAGVIPRLRREGPWDVVAFRPGGEPLRALVEALGPEVGEAADVAGVAEERVRTRVGDVRSLLIVADQFEELFTHGAASESVDELLRVLIRIAGMGAGEGGEGDGRVKVLVTFRGDFYGRLVAHRAFSDALQDHVVHLPPMDLAELRQAIVEPARAAGVALEEGLADRILAEAGAEPGVLPLLEFALTRLWETRSGSALTHKDYSRIGRLAGAISSRAEEVYGALSPERQYTARQVLVRLVQVARPEEDGNDARRRTAVAQLAALPRVDSVLGALADARLVVTDAGTAGDGEGVAGGGGEGVAAGGGATVELAHEAIIRSWDRLRGWLVEDRQFLLWQQRVRQWFEEWRLAGGAQTALLRGPILEEARRWEAEKGQDAIAPDLLDYLNLSLREYEVEQESQIAARIDRLLTARPADVAAIAEGCAGEIEAAHAMLAERLEVAEQRELWRIRVALLHWDPRQVEELVREVEYLAPDELVPVREVLLPFADTVVDALWRRTGVGVTSSAVQLRIAVVLAGLAATDARWTGIAEHVARALVRQDRIHLHTFVDALRPVRDFLLEPLYGIYTDDEELRSANRELTAAILRVLGGDRPGLLARVVADSPLRGGEASFRALQQVVDDEALDVLRRIAAEPSGSGAEAGERLRVGRRRSAAVATLLRLGARVDVAELFSPSADPELVAQLARAAPAREVPAAALVELLETTTSDAVRYALLVALGEYPVDGFDSGVRAALARLVGRMEAECDDSGVHSAAAWFARRLGEGVGGSQGVGAAALGVGRGDTQSAYDPSGRRGWFTVDVGGFRLTFVVFRPGRFVMGSPDDEPGRAVNEGPARETRITRSFALCRAEVTRGEFEAFVAATKASGLPDVEEWSARSADPVVAVTWMEAMQFATWANAVAIGKRLGIAYTFGLQEPARSRAFLGLPERVGSLRLPTEAEWEYACRSGTGTAFSFGSDRSLLNRYGWFADNSERRTHEAGLLRPGPTGLFNMHGQCWEWCLDWYGPYVGGAGTGAAVDPVGPLDGDRKVVRGGSWNLGARYARSASRDAHIPSNRNYNVSFRLALTVPEIDPAWPKRRNPLPWTG